MELSKERAQRKTTRASAGWPGPLLHGQVTSKVKSPLRLPTLREPRKRTAEGQSSGREKRTQRDSATSYDFSYESYPSSSVSPLSLVTSVEVRAPFQATSSPNMFVKSRFEEFTPDITADKHNETFRLRCCDAFESSPTEHEREPGGDADVLTETAASFAAASNSVTGASPAAGQQEFTPDISADEGDETFRLRCSGPGLYLCNVTGLVFHMGGDGGEVVYRIVPWDWRLLDRHHKKPAGPLFNIECEQRSVLGLHLPHCEIQSGGGGDFLSVAHVEDEGVEFLRPREVTVTHVVVDVSGLSALGNVRDGDSPPQPVRALVLLFYRPPNDPDDPESLLNVLMLPSNAVVDKVLSARGKLVEPESYIETTSQCKLHPGREYVLSTSPQNNRVIVQPTKAEFHCNYDNYIPSFQVILKRRLKHIKLFLKESDGGVGVWERRVGLSTVRPSSRPSTLDLVHSKSLMEVRRDLVKRISGPVLKSLLDRLLEEKVITDDEREAAEAKPNRSDSARFVIDTVRKKGEEARSKMIGFLMADDPFLCEHLGLF